MHALTQPLYVELRCALDRSHIFCRTPRKLRAIEFCTIPHACELLGCTLLEVPCIKLCQLTYGHKLLRHLCHPRRAQGLGLRPHQRAHDTLLCISARLLSDGGHSHGGRGSRVQRRESALGLVALFGSRCRLGSHCRGSLGVRRRKDLSRRRPGTNLSRSLPVGG